MMESDESMTYPAAVGALIHVDKVISILKEHHDESAALVDVAISTVGHQPLTKEQASLVKDFWIISRFQFFKFYFILSSV